MGVYSTTLITNEGTPRRNFGMRFLKCLIVTGFVALAGCTFTPKELELYAHPTISETNIGADTALYFRFVDDRDETTVGVRGASNSGSKITAANLAEYVEHELREGLEAKGYILIKDKQEAVAEITYRLRAFKFSLNMGFWTGAENKSAVIAVDAEKGEVDYAKTYRVDDEDREMFVPGGDEINEEMNAALAAVLNKAMNDGALDLFLIQ
jgi:uncharacterized lipoprotein YajG